jgi:hypothetical protein
MPRMKPAQPLITQDKLDAFIAFGLSWLVWLLAVILKLGAPRRSRLLRRFVEKLERYVEVVVFLMAVRAIALKRRRPRLMPVNAPPGFRRLYARRRRLLFKHARICDRRLSLHQRVFRLIAALANPAPYIARFAARLRRRLRLDAIIPFAPPAHACADLAQPPCAFADSS